MKRGRATVVGVILPRSGALAGRALNRRDLTAQDQRRFWSHVLKTDGCWLWQGGESAKYGLFFFRGAQQPAHRVSAAIAFGEVPAGAVVMHHCDVPRCVRPTHLAVASQKENVRDCIKKGRYRKHTALAS